MKEKYFNLKIHDWNFDYARGVRFPIFGAIVELPIEVGDKFPQYFKRVEKIEVVKEVEPKLVNNTETLKVVTEPNMDASLQELFESDLQEGKVKESKKFYIWNEHKINKEEYENSNNKSEFLYEILN